jgi:uncharacterized protein
MTCGHRHCPSCGRIVARAGNDAWPFCSARCRLVDLGRWLAEDYRIAGPPSGDGAPARPVDGEEGE